MKIKSYKKIKNNCYQLEFINNEESIILYDDVILKYNLLLKSEIDDLTLKDIKKENNSLHCYYKSLNYLNYKNRSKKELKDYLIKNNFKKEDIDKTITLLEEKNILNEDIYLKNFINTKIKITNDGPIKITKKLIDLGLEENKIKEYLDSFDNNVWLNKIDNLINKKVKSNHNKSINSLKTKILYDLLNEGFIKEDILNKLDLINDLDNENILEKEFNKIYQKLSKKYQDKELFYQIKIKLLNKGFNYDNIEEIINKKN